MTVVAIDGPAGAGKSTVAKLVARHLGFTYVDTGAMYRAIALAGLERGLDDESLASTLDSIRLEMVDGRIHLDGKDVSRRIRESDVTRKVARISADPRVRDHLLELQRRFGEEGRVVIEGRDIGTVVCPNAEVKVFLSANLEARAARRLRDSDANGQDLEQVRADIAARDAFDSQRSTSPLKKAEDAVEIDTTNLSIDEVVGAIARLVERVGR